MLVVVGAAAGTIEVVVVADNAEFAVQQDKKREALQASMVFAVPWEASVVPVLEGLLQLAEVDEP